MKDDQALDEIRQRMQASLIKAKEDELREEFGMAFGFTDPTLPVDVYHKWLDHILAFEKSWAGAARVTIFEKIGRPRLRAVDEIPADRMEEAVNDLLDRLLDHNVAVCFLGEWDERAAYRYLIEELLPCEIEDITIEGMMACFDAATPAYEVQMWVEMFVRDILWQERDRVLEQLAGRTLVDEQGSPLPSARFVEKLDAVWARRPVIEHFEITPQTTTVEARTAAVTALIDWTEKEQAYQIKSGFRLMVSPDFGWDVVGSTLLDDLLALDG